jgi:hypothetical protein
MLPMNEAPIITETARAIVAELYLARGNAPVRMKFSASGLYANLSLSCFTYRNDLRGNFEELVSPVPLPDYIISLVAQFRDECYIPNKGTWYSMEVELTIDGQIELTLNYKDEPLRFGKSYELDEYLGELVKYPVASNERQDWLVAKLARDTMSL